MTRHTPPDLTAGTATVRSDPESDWDGPKSNTSERSVVIDPGTLDDLRAHRNTQNEARFLWGAGWTETGLVFTHEDGRALTPNRVSQRFDRLLKRHDLPPIRLYDVRHGSATLALTAGADIKVVAEQLGHSTTQITHDVYMSVMPQVARRPQTQQRHWSPRRFCSRWAHHVPTSEHSGNRR